MHNHQPPDYTCPFCGIVQGRYDAWTVAEDVVYRDTMVTAFISAAWWPNNAGHVLIIPNQHHENIYDLPLEAATAIHRVAHEIAIAFMEVYDASGTSTRQHNGPDGNQEVWHYHLHVFPRYAGDKLYGSTRWLPTPDERRPYADKLRAYFNHQIYP